MYNLFFYQPIFKHIDEHWYCTIKMKEVKKTFDYRYHRLKVTHGQKFVKI